MEKILNILEKYLNPIRTTPDYKYGTFLNVIGKCLNVIGKTQVLQGKVLNILDKTPEFYSVIYGMPKGKFMNVIG